MMKKLFVAFSHTLTDEQIQNAQTSLGVQEIQTLRDVDPELQRLFSQIPVDADLSFCKGIAGRVIDHAKAFNATHIYVAGELCVSIHANLLAMASGLHCVVSTTAREAVETPQSDGSIKVVHSFKHVMWRDVF